MSETPFAPPAVDSHAADDDVVEALQRMRPWQMFLGSLAALGALLIGGVCVSILAVGAAAMVTGGDAAEGGLVMVLGGLFYGLAGLVYAVMAWRLLGSAWAIGRIGSEGVVAVRDAMVHQAKLWQTLGVLAILTIVATVGAVLVGVIAAMAFGSGLSDL